MDNKQTVCEITGSQRNVIFQKNVENIMEKTHKEILKEISVKRNLVTQKETINFFDIL